ASLTAPSLKSGTAELKNLQLASLSLDNLKLTVKDARCGAVAGDLSIKTGEQPVKFSGSLQDLIVSYDGKLNAPRTFDPSGTFSLQCKANDCAISSESNGRAVTLQVNGSLDVNSTRAENKDLLLVLS